MTSLNYAEAPSTPSVRKPQRGRDIQLQIWLRYGEALYGSEKVIRFMRREMCPHCAGSGAAAGGSHAGCSACNETGEAHNMQGVTVPCATCDGYGNVPSLPCPACGGSRVVYKPHKLRMQIHERWKRDRITRVRYANLGDPSRSGGANGDLIVFVLVEPL